MFLYLRMGISIVVNLYTMRVVWQVLGIDNYGIYTVVGGIVLMFQFLNSAMVASSQRFISYELGIGNAISLKKIFSISVTIHYLLAGIILLLAETIGLWFLNNKLNIPIERMTAANWVYQCSILSFLVSVISVPYNACIVAHEHMKVYGYVGILDVFLRLGAVYFLILIPFDKLITYAILILFVHLIVRIIYQVYCRKNFSECKYKFQKDKHIMRDMFAFAGWSFLGNMGLSIREQGLTFILNMFFNVAMNAAKGIAGQVTNVIAGFASNFQMALNPQITKTYAQGEINSTISLIYRGCKFSLILMSLIAVPLWIASEEVLKLWLDDITPASVVFLRLSLIMVIFDITANPIITAIQATGNIKKFQILIVVIMSASIPMAWLYMKIHPDPYSVMYVAILCSVIALFTRLKLLSNLIPVSLTFFACRILLPVLIVLIFSGSISYILYSNLSNNLWSIVIMTIINSFLFLGSTYLVLLNKNEKKFIINIVTKKLNI